MESCVYMPDTPNHRDSMRFVEAFDRDGFFGRERFEGTAQQTKPNSTYSIRTRCLAELKERVRFVSGGRRDDFVAPTEQAIDAARTFINGMVDGVLSVGCRIAISHDGEINFFFQKGADLFQILIDNDGQLSYYGQSQEGEMLGSGMPAGRFPHLRLLMFLGG